MFAPTSWKAFTSRRYLASSFVVVFQCCQLWQCFGNYCDLNVVSLFWSWLISISVLVFEKDYSNFVLYIREVIGIWSWFWWIKVKYLAQKDRGVGNTGFFLNKFIKKEMPLIFCFLPNQNDVVSFKQKTKGQNYFPFAWFFLEFIVDFEDFYLSKLTRAKMLSVLLSINNLENMTFLFSVFFLFHIIFFPCFLIVFHEKITIYLLQFSSSLSYLSHFN